MRILLASALALASPAALAADSFLMGALGDSITAATFADGHANADSAPPEEEAMDTRGWIPFLGNKENKGKLSFASGTSIDSHYLRLGRYLADHGGGELDVLNVAVPGEKSDGIVAQVDQLLDAMNGGKYRALKYVTFVIGANDACKEVDNEDMRASLRAAWAELAKIQQSEPLRVLVSALPRIPDLGRKRIVDMKTVAGLRCGKLRDDMLKFCRPLTVWDTRAEYLERVAIVEAKNRVIEEAASEAATKYPQLSIALSRAFWTTPIDPELMAADCFHPDTAGHEMLADKLWRDQPWFH